MKKQYVSFLLLLTFFLEGSLSYAFSKHHPEKTNTEYSISEGTGSYYDFIQPAFSFNTQVVKDSAPGDVIITNDHWVLKSSFKARPILTISAPKYWQNTLFQLIYPFHSFG